MLFAAALLWSGLASALADVPPLPATPPDHIAFAQISDSAIRDPAALAKSRAFVWGAHLATVKSGVFGSYYYPSNRDFDKSHTFAWYRANRPDWVAYQCDRKMPAYDHVYSWGAYVPLDITRDDVRRSIMDEFIRPAIGSGFRIVALDNVSIANGAKRCGVWRNGEWLQQFQGTSRDDKFVEAILDYIGWLRREIHGQNAAVALNAKTYFENPEATARLIALADIWLDEGGFSSHCNKRIVDGAWKVKFDLARAAGSDRGYVSMNTLCVPYALAPPAELNWIVANFLLVRGAHSYLAVVGPGDSGKLLDYAGLDVPVGQPSGEPRSDGDVMLRDYEHGLVAVNPSSRRTVALALPPGTWTDQSGAVVAPELNLPPRSGIVLLKAGGR